MNELDTKKRILEIAEFGKQDDGAITRLLFSEEYRKASEYLCSYMKETGLEVRIDTVGNIHGVYYCGIPDSKTILVGSHLDTVKEGGRFDGVLGIVGAVECVKELINTKQPLRHNLHIIATNGEEGNDLGGTFGSRCLTGLVDISQPGYLDIAKRYGITGEDILNARLDTKEISCYLELHIEQGKTLYEEKEDIGIVTGIVGLRRYQIEVQGECNHAGTTMMCYRHDAMVGAAKLITEIDALTREYANNLVSTFGQLELHPGAVAVIPGYVKMVLEIRNQDNKLLDSFYQEIIRLSDQIEDVSITFQKIVEKDPVNCDPVIIACMNEVCDNSGILYREMQSGATHDANAMAFKLPIGMLFVPSKDGISHSRFEWTDWNKIQKGVEVLYQLILKVDRSMD